MSLISHLFYMAAEDIKMRPKKKRKKESGKDSQKGELNKQPTHSIKLESQ